MKKALLLLLLLSVKGFSQIKRDNHWFFGWEAGLDFSSGVPKADTNGKLISIEGCSSISDTAGNLLFYTNGEKVWNRNHLVMPNGNGLVGNQSSSQSSLIIPDPGNSDLYYIFTTDAFAYSTRMSTVNMSLDGGLGDITTDKNFRLYLDGTEELAGTMHCNARDYWMVCRQMIRDSIKLHAYLISAGGISKMVTSTFGMKNGKYNYVGNLTFSQDGKTLCLTSFDTQIALFRFNTFSGKISLKERVELYPNEWAYSSAFSPDATKLYVTAWNNYGFCYLSQFDLSISTVAATRINLDSVDYSRGSPSGYGFLGHIRLASDQKIYMSRWHQEKPFKVHPTSYYSLDSLDVIHYPNRPASSCMFKRNALYLESKPTQISLPNFVSNFTAIASPENTCLMENKYESADFKVVESFPHIFLGQNTSIENITPPIQIVSAYPNPFSDKIILQTSQQLTDASLLISNNLGQIVRQMHRISGEKIVIKREALAAGVYNATLIQNSQCLLVYKLMVVDP